MPRIFARLRTHATSMRGRYGPAWILAIASLWLGWPWPGIAQAQPGPVVLVGDVLPFNQREIWSRIAELAPDPVIVAAASERPALYGDFARRALRRHGAFAALLPLALDSAEFGIDHRRAVEDPALLDEVNEASGVFFVGGAPQRLASVLFRTGGSPTPLASAVAGAHAAGAVIVGGIPGSAGLSTGIDALEVLARGSIAPEHILRGLDLAPKGWFVDQHAFSPGRLAEVLVAMHQLGIARGMGVGARTSAVIDDGEVEVAGDEGVLLIDLTGSRATADLDEGFRLGGARLTYLEHGDRFDLRTLEVEPSAAKRDGFEIEPGDETPPSSDHDRSVAGDLLARGQLPRLLREAADGSRREASGFVFPQDAGDGERGFRFLFHSLPETKGWLSVDSGPVRYTIVNVGLDISPATRADTPGW